jgi:hypothetical protein
MLTRGRRCPFAARYRCAEVTLSPAPDGIAGRRSALTHARTRPLSRPSHGNASPSLVALRRQAGKYVGSACTAGSPLARAQCCVAPSLCFAASKRAVHRARCTVVSFAARPRATALQREFRTIGTAFALSLASGSTWIRRECNNKVLAAAQVRTTASPEFSHRLGSRDAVFISGIASAQQPTGSDSSPAH